MIILLMILLLSSCTVVADRKGDKLILKGFGAKGAKWADGAEITKEEPLKVPNVFTK